MKRVLITIPKKGPTRVEAFGYQGEGCKATVDAIANALGRGVDETQKPEFFEAEVSETEQEHEQQ